MLLDLWAEGARYRAPCTDPLVITGNFPNLRGQPVHGFRLTHIEAIDVTQIPPGSRTSKEDRFVDQVRDFERNRNEHPDNPAFNPGWEDPDGEKAAVFAQLRSRFFPREGLTCQNLMLVLHGCDKDMAEAVCVNGFEQLNYRDQGWFGQGVYSTTYAEYACLFATGQLKARLNEPTTTGEYVMLACWVAPGMCYPISRRIDYARPRTQSSLSKFYDDAPGRPLKGQFQSHYAAIEGRHYQCVDDLRGGNAPDYDELVVRHPAQMLPAYRLYFRAEEHW